jgi:hypothetical protein
MTLSDLSKPMLVTLGLGLVALPIVSSSAFARPARNLERVQPYWLDYGRDGTNYDREVNGSDASTPGHN